MLMSLSIRRDLQKGIKNTKSSKCMNKCKCFSLLFKSLQNVINCLYIIKMYCAIHNKNEIKYIIAKAQKAEVENGYILLKVLILYME